MLFHWIRIILSNKYVEFFYFHRKRNNPGKGALNPLGWSETRKTEIHPTRILSEPEIHSTHILSEPEIHPTRILPELVYTRPVFNLLVRIDKSSPTFGTWEFFIVFVGQFQMIFSIRKTNTWDSNCKRSFWCLTWWEKYNKKCPSTEENKYLQKQHY